MGLALREEGVELQKAGPGIWDGTADRVVTEELVLPWAGEQIGRSQVEGAKAFLVERAAGLLGARHRRGHALVLARCCTLHGPIQTEQKMSSAADPPSTDLSRLAGLDDLRRLQDLERLSLVCDCACSEVHWPRYVVVELASRVRLHLPTLGLLLLGGRQERRGRLLLLQAPVDLGYLPEVPGGHFGARHHVLDQIGLPVEEGAGVVCLTYCQESAAASALDLVLLLLLDQLNETLVAGERTFTWTSR